MTESKSYEWYVSGPSMGVVEVAHRLQASIARTPRAKCVICHQRRVLYRIVVGSDVAVDMTEARCATCWGVRE